MYDMNPVFIPGPTNIPDRIRNAMQVQTRDHRAPDFVDTFAPVLRDLKRVFKTESGEVMLFPASGTGGWEAAISNVLSPGDKVLIARYGMFSHRWIDLCQRHGLDVEVIDCAWGDAAPADRFEEYLRADNPRRCKAVLVTHNETATGVVSDIGAVRSALDACGHPALLLVDCVSSLACMPFEMDRWGVDVAICGSQKGFMLNTGMAILAASQKALAAAVSAKLPRTFFDFRSMIDANANGAFPYTPSLQLILGLRESLDMLFEEGLENVFARHHRLAQGVRLAARAWDMRLGANAAGLESETVTAIYVPEGYDANRLVEHAFDRYDLSLGIGLGEMSKKAFRIGHLGALTDVLLLAGIATVEMAMADLDYPIELGSGVAAAQQHYRRTAVSGEASA